MYLHGNLTPEDRDNTCLQSSRTNSTHDPVWCNNAQLSHNSDMCHLNVIITSLLYQAAPVEKLIVSQLA